MSQVLSKHSGFFSSLVNIRSLFGVCAAILFFACAASAQFSPDLESVFNNGNGTFTFNYRLDVGNLQRLDPPATNGVTCPGPGGTVIQCNPTGTFVTIYDIVGFVSASTTNPDFTVMTQLLGRTPSRQNPFDDAGMTNVTFYYNDAAPVIAGPTSFVTFSIISTAGGSNPFGGYTSQATNNDPMGSSNGLTDQASGSVTVPRVITTAASVTIGGRVTNSEGRGLGGVTITLSGGNLPQAVHARTSSFGYYSFDDIPAGQTYIIRVHSKRYVFNPSTRVMDVLDNVSDADFIAEPQ